MEHTNARNREQRTSYELHRLREPGAKGLVRLPIIEEHAGLDRARLAAFGYALDGPTATGERFTGTVEVYRNTYCGEQPIRIELVDVIDERVAFRLLNDIKLPRAATLSVPIERLQEEVNRLKRLGID